MIGETVLNFETYAEVKDLTYNELITRRDESGHINKRILTYLRIAIEDLMNSEITESQDGMTYGIDARKSKFFFITPIQSSNSEQDGTTLMELGDLINELLEDYSIKRIDGYRDVGICGRFEVDGSEGKFLKDGIHPNYDGYVKMGETISGEILSTYLK